MATARKHTWSASSATTRANASPKKVSTLKRGDSNEQKRTNEIGMAIPLLDECAIAGRDISADALLTQRALARYIVSRGAHYHFTVKGNQKTLAQDIRRDFAQPGEADYTEPTRIAHGRIETRRIWTSTALNDYLRLTANSASAATRNA